MKFRLAAIAAAVAATLALAACGGGGNDGNGFAPIGVLPSPPPAPAPAPTPPPAEPPAPAPAPATSTFLYEQLPYPADGGAFLNDLNTEGTKGFRFLGALTDAQSGAGANVYYKTGSITYVYETKATPTDASAFLAQANEAGGRGYRWAGASSVNNVPVMIYRKESGTDATYTYRTEAAAASRSEFITRGNAQGADGYFNTAPAYVFGSAMVAVFEKSSSGNSTFAYEVKDNASDVGATLAQFEEAGARGFRFRGPYSFGNIFAKDLSQSSTFTYQALVPKDTLSAELEQSNTLGADGFALIGPMIVNSQTRNYYYKATNCTGPALCMPTSPFGV